MHLLGSSIAYRDAATRFGLMPVSVFLDQLSCTGQESALLECRSRPYGISECDASDVAGAQCVGMCICVHRAKVNCISLS